MSFVKKSQPKTGNSIQDVCGRNKRPSKYKAIEPSKLENLVQYQPDKYKLLPESTLSHLLKDHMVKLVFVNREEIWVSIHFVDHEEETGRPLCCNLLKCVLGTCTV